RQAQPALMPLIDQGRPFRRRPPNSYHGRPSEVGTPVDPSSGATQASKRCGLPDGLGRPSNNLEPVVEMIASWSDAFSQRALLIGASGCHAILLLGSDSDRMSSQI